MDAKKWEQVLSCARDARWMTQDQRETLAETAADMEREKGFNAAVRMLEAATEFKPAPPASPPMAELVLFWMGRDTRDMGAVELRKALHTLAATHPMVNRR